MGRALHTVPGSSRLRISYPGGLRITRAYFCNSTAGDQHTALPGPKVEYERPMSFPLPILFSKNDAAIAEPVQCTFERVGIGELAQSSDRFGQRRKNMVKVLVVDDNRAGRDLIRAILKSLPCEIVEASHGQQGLDLLRRERPDLVLLDIDMPGMDGLEVVKRIREDATYADLPVVAVTAFAMDGDREKAMAAGFTAYVTKPVRAAGLRQTVQELLGRLKD